MANKEGNRIKLQNQEAATTYLLFCSGHVYSLLVSRWALTTASWRGKVPVLSSSSSSGPWENLAGTLATRGTQHRGATFLPTLHWFSDRSPAQVWKGKQRQAADHSGEGCPGGRSDGYVPPWGQWSTGLAGGCPGGRGRNSAFGGLTVRLQKWCSAVSSQWAAVSWWSAGELKIAASFESPLSTFWTSFLWWCEPCSALGPLLPAKPGLGKGGVKVWPGGHS